MFSEVEINIILADFMIHNLSLADEESQILKPYRIVDEKAQFSYLGSITFCPKQSKTSRGILKSPPKRQLSGLSPVKKTNNATKQNKFASPPTKQVESPMPSSVAPKIDVTSMMSVTLNMSNNEKSYKCSFCSQETALLTSMKRHIETKHLPSTTSFDCRNCEYKTKLKFMLKKHYMNKHAMPEPAAQGMMTCYN